MSPPRAAVLSENQPWMPQQGGKRSGERAEQLLLPLGRSVCRELSPSAVGCVLMSQYTPLPCTSLLAPGNYLTVSRGLGDSHCCQSCPDMKQHLPIMGWLKGIAKVRARPLAGARCVGFLTKGCAAIQHNFSEGGYAHSALAILRKQPCLNHLSHLAI